MPNSNRGKAVIYLTNVPPGVKAHFKAWCARHGWSMRDKIVDLMRKTAAQDERHLAQEGKR